METTNTTLTQDELTARRKEAARKAAETRRQRAGAPAPAPKVELTDEQRATRRKEAAAKAAATRKARQQVAGEPQRQLVTCPHCNAVQVGTTAAGHAKRYGKCYH